MPELWAIQGTLVHTPTFGSISLARQTTLIVNKGVITHVETAACVADLLAKHGLEASSVLRLEVVRQPSPAELKHQARQC